LARQLANYHRQNKVYKELVPEFIKIVKDRDNILRVKLPETNYYTSGFGDIYIYASHAAPEVVNRRMPNTPMSDCYTFAILAFELLEFCHPFLGDDAIKNNRYDDAFKGRLAWIDNPDDDSNRHITRYYDRAFTTMPLWQLFAKTFTEGKFDVFYRPSIFEWLDALEDEQKKLRFCPNCKTDFLCYDVDDECPFCDDSLRISHQNSSLTTIDLRKMRLK
jgi:DNA-binding helix-hairpin-helix protein with protein kinase domain